MSYCPNCGNKLEPGHNFCSNCGQKPTQEKPQNPQPRKPKNRNWVMIVALILIIIVIAAIVSIVVTRDWNPQPAPISFPTYTYQPPTQTYQPTSTYTAPTTHTLMTDQTLSAGYHFSDYYTVAAGKTITVSWSASTNVDVYIFTDANYNYWLQGSYIYDAAKTASSGTLSYYVTNSDTYYIVVKNPNALGFGAAVTVYSATASW